MTANSICTMSAISKSKALLEQCLTLKLKKDWPKKKIKQKIQKKNQKLFIPEKIALFSLTFLKDKPPIIFT